MTLTIFDLDHTLINGDSDLVWGEFICEQGLVEPISYQRINTDFYQQYEQGHLDMPDYIEFMFKSLKDYDLTTLTQYRDIYIQRCIKPIIIPRALKLIEMHRQRGDLLLIITATNQFLAQPIASLLGIENIIATKLECIDGYFTGRIVGTASYQEGKVECIKAWLKTNNIEGSIESIFYSDSHNDLPLLSYVDTPVAVDPDPKLREIAINKEWKIISLKNEAIPLANLKSNLLAEM
jgi:HAD superfamily hydrolase (TIGR01490 family)